MEITHKIKMDLNRPGITPRIPAVQGDAYSRKLSISLYSDRRPWRIPSGASVVIRYLKPDRTSGSYDTLPDGTSAVRVSGNTIRILVAPQALSLAGTVSLMVTILLGEQRLSTFSMELEVAPDCVSGWTDEDGAAWIAAFLPAPESAEPGHHLAVKTVDDAGRVLTVKAVDTAQWLEDYLTESGIMESVSVSHAWDGTILTVTSASGTSSADLKGEKGDTGTQGPQGEKGETGEQGPQGKSAYEYAQDGGYAGTEEEFAAKLGTDALIGDTGSITPAQVVEALQAGRNICLTHIDAGLGPLTFTSFMYGSGFNGVMSSALMKFANGVFLGELHGKLSDGSWLLYTPQIAQYTDIPTTLPNPNTLTINGQVYDGSEAVNITITGGAESDNDLIGQTPITLTESASVKLVGEGEHTYTVKGKTVADLSTATISKSNAEMIEHEDYIEISDTGASAWYSSCVQLSFSGLTVGTTYVLAVVGLGLDTTNLISGGYYAINNASGTQLATLLPNSISINSVEFTPDTSDITVVCYPAGNYYWSKDYRTAHIGDLYINEASDGTERTDIINQSGTFTDSYALGQVSQGVTITAEPSCEVYSASSDNSVSAVALPLAGKAVVCFGDSLFGMYTGDTSAPAYVAERTGATVYNVGFGGCRMAVHPYVGYNEFCMYALATAVASGDWSVQDAAVSSGSSNFPDQLAILKEIDFSKVDAIVIHYGTNDFTAGAGVAIDNADDPKDYNTLCGALRYSVETLLTAYPHLRIFVSVPAFRYWTAEDGTVTYSDTYTNVNSNTLPEFVDAIASTAKEYNLPVIDSYYGLGINKINAATFLADGVHHNEVGRKRFGEYIGSCMIAGY